MATQRIQGTRRYRIDGNAAYQPEFEQEHVRPSSRRERMNAVPVRQPRPRSRHQPRVRPSIEVRSQGAVAPFTVVGLFVVLACTLMLVVSSAQLAVANNDIVELRSTLADLQDESRNLQTKYELVYDLEAIEKQLLSDGSMVRPGTGQTVYLDLSGGDRVVYYDGAGEGLSGLLQRAERFFEDLLS